VQVAALEVGELLELVGVGVHELLQTALVGEHDAVVHVLHLHQLVHTLNLGARRLGRVLLLVELEHFESAVEFVKPQFEVCGVRDVELSPVFAEEFVGEERVVEQKHCAHPLPGELVEVHLEHGGLVVVVELLLHAVSQETLNALCAVRQIVGHHGFEHVAVQLRLLERE